MPPSLKIYQRTADISLCKITCLKTSYRFTGTKKVVETASKTTKKVSETSKTHISTTPKPLPKTNEQSKVHSISDSDKKCTTPPISKEKPAHISNTNKDIQSIQKSITIPENSKPGYYGIFKPVWANNGKDSSQKTLTTISNKQYSTNISEKSDPNALTPENIIDEMTKRELVKTDKGNTSVTLKLENENEVILGEAKHGCKLTPLGQAYSAQVTQKSEKNKEDTEDTSVSPQEPLKTRLVVPPATPPETLIETGKQKHILVVYTPENNEYLAFAYLTSKKTGKFLSNEQFKTYQNKKENISDSSVESKIQCYYPFDNFEKIPVNLVNILKWDKEYLSTLSPEVQKTLEKSIEKLSKKYTRDFDSVGITREIGIKMCIVHDNNVQAKKKHPLTAEQKWLNEQNTLKQKEEHNAKKLNKDDDDN